MASSSKRRDAMTAFANEELKMDMSPMIDLTFLLLVFFMVASHLITVEIDRRVKPPNATTATVAEVARGRVVVNITADGRVWASGEVELPTSGALEDYLKIAREANDEAGVTPTRLNLRADKEVDTRAIKKVVQAAGNAGVNEVIFGSLATDE